jgi:hypothetical protein
MMVAPAAIQTLLSMTFDDADEIRAVFSDLIGHKVDGSIRSFPLVAFEFGFRHSK